MITLNVWLDQTLVGRLTHDAPVNRFSFRYAAEWLQTPHRFALSPQMPLEPAERSAEQESAAVRQFFENLLPEGEALDHAAQAAGTSKSNLVGLLIALGHETAGAVRVTLADGPAQSQPERLQLVTPHELSERIRKRQEIPFSVWDGRVRLSIAGYQDKIAVYEKDGHWFLVDGARLASTVIVKPVPFSTNMKTLPENEHFCMELARRVGLAAAPTRLVRVPEPVLLVDRFDRHEERERVARLHVIDGCQALGLPVAMKYERSYGDAPDVANIREGASLPKLFSLIRALSPAPAVDVRGLLRWTVFQILVGNADAHGKNISFFCGSEGLRLAPAYDIVCIPALDAKLSTNYAMAIGDSFTSADLSPYEWAHFAHLCRLPFGLVAAELASMARRVLDALEDVSLAAVSDGVTDEVAKNIVHLVRAESLRQLEFAPGVKKFKARDFT